MAKKDAGTDAGYQKLKSDLRAKTPGKLYVFYGEEAYLRAHHLQLLKKTLVDGLTEEFNFHRFTPENFSMDALSDSVEAYPMMAEHSMVQVEELDLFKLPEAEREHMIAILSDIPDYCCVVFVYETVPFKPDKRQKKLWDAISQNATIVEFRKQGERELCDWITRHFAAQGKQIDFELCRYLIVQTGGAMTTLNGEIGKIAAFCSGTKVTKADINAVVEPVLEAVVFDISNAIAAGNFSLALTKLRTLLQKQEEPISIMAAIGSQMRRLHAARVLIDSGKGADSLMQLYGLGEYPARLTMNQAGRLSTAFCRRAVLLCLQIDEQLKTSADAPERLLELLILQLAQGDKA